MNIKINFNREKKNTRYISDLLKTVKHLCLDRNILLKDVVDEMEMEFNDFYNQLTASNVDTQFILKVVSIIDPKLKVQIDLETSTLKIV